MSALIIGLKGTVLALDRATGETLWSTPLKGSDFVSIVVEEGAVFAATRGRVYRLDVSTGAILWSNDLPGLGFGIVSIAGTSSAALMAERKRRDAASAGAAGSPG